MKILSLEIQLIRLFIVNLSNHIIANSINGFFVFLNLFPADPKFSAPISNVTVAVGREAILTCVVHDLGSYKVRFFVEGFVGVRT
jgi:hypothetical protein